MTEPLKVCTVEMRDPRVAQLLEEAFPSDAEARLVFALAADEPALVSGLSLGALRGEQLVGYVLFTRVWVGPDAVEALSLAPLAVAEESRGLNIGRLLVLDGLRRARALGESAVIVLGYPDYYARLGFEPARPLGIEPPWPDVPDEAWLALELEDGALATMNGVVQFAAAFNEVI